MKKIALLLVFLLTFAPFANAESIDIQSMSSEELTSLRAAINAELLSRGIEKEVIVPAGTYKVGEDIPAGVYTITTDAYAISFNTYDEYGNYDEIHLIQPSCPIGKLTLTDGQIVEFTSGNVTFAPYAGLGF